MDCCGSVHNGTAVTTLEYMFLHDEEPAHQSKNEAEGANVYKGYSANASECGCECTPVSGTGNTGKQADDKQDRATRHSENQRDEKNIADCNCRAAQATYLSGHQRSTVTNLAGRVRFEIVCLGCFHPDSPVWRKFTPSRPRPGVQGLYSETWNPW
jgi:hypothetical protein